MIIDVKKLIASKKYVGNFTYDYTPAQEKVVLPLTGFDGNVKVEGEYEIFDDDSVRIMLTLSYGLSGKCSYCLEDAHKDIKFTSDILFVTDKGDFDNYFYDGYKIDLTTAVEDALVISQPDVILCKEGCGGIKIN